MKRRTLVVLAVAAFLVTLLLHAPAALVLKPSKDGSTQWVGAEGTVSSGRVAALVVNQRPIVTGLQWTLRPWWLALLRVTLDVQAGSDSVLRARVSRALFGKLHLSGIEAAIDVRSMMAALGQPMLPLEGQVHLVFDSLKFDQGLPVQAQGTAELHGIAWTLAREPLKIGDVTAAFDTDDKGVLATLSSGPGPLELGGEARLGPDRTYDANLQMRPRAEAGEQLRALLKSLGTPDSQGWYHLRRQGTL
jgi:hypothetical protein